MRLLCSLFCLIFAVALGMSAPPAQASNTKQTELHVSQHSPPCIQVMEIAKTNAIAVIENTEADNTYHLARFCAVPGYPVIARDDRSSMVYSLSEFSRNRVAYFAFRAAENRVPSFHLLC